MYSDWGHRRPGLARSAMGGLMGLAANARGVATGVLLARPPQEIVMKTYVCIVCGFVYDEAAGRPEDDIAPGTVWADVPDSWACPDCGVTKADFEMVEL